MSKKQKRMFWPVFSVVVVTLGALAFASAHTARRTLSTHGSTDLGRADESGVVTQAPNETKTVAILQGTSLRGPIQNVRFTLYNGGIYPRQLHAKPGNVAIGVEDRTGNSLGLVIERQTDSLTVLVGQVSPVLNHLRGRAQFSLESGRYVVFDASRPNNRAGLLVEP